MTPYDKAIELINMFSQIIRMKLGQEGVRSRAKECAIIYCDGIIDEVTDINSKKPIALDIILFYTETKNQIKNL